MRELTMPSQQCLRSGLAAIAFALPVLFGGCTAPGAGGVLDGTPTSVAVPTKVPAVAPPATVIPPTATTRPTEAPAKTVVPPTATPKPTESPILVLPLDKLPATIAAVTEFANAMKAAGVATTAEQILQKGLTTKEIVGKDGSKYQIASTQDGYPLMLKVGGGVWREATLKDLAQSNGVRVGVYVGSYGVEKDWQLRDAIQQREFNGGFVAGSWNSIQTGKGIIDYPKSFDQDVARAKSPGMEEVYFHTMTWFMQTPEYLRSLSSEQVETQVGTYIKDYVTRYSTTTGKKSIFNVVNEAFYTYNGGDVLRQKLGEDYVTLLFREAAKAAKSGDTLVYSDYDIIPRASSQEKRNDVKVRTILRKLLDDPEIKKTGVTIGLGMQASLISGNDLTSQEIAAIIDGYGVPVYVTEADVLMGNDNSSDRLLTQSENYRTLMKGILQSNNCRSIYVFGTDDAASWYERQPDLADYSRVADPLLFDDNFKKKAAYYGLSSALFEGLPASN
jgi:GH35 family endo-1,4-beta-xylanase